MTKVGVGVVSAFGLDPSRTDALQTVIRAVDGFKPSLLGLLSA
jgi:hypothetical protein